MKILLAMDGSAQAAEAEKFLARLAGRAGHEVTVLNVTPPLTGLEGSMQKAIAEVLRNTGARMVREAAARLSRKGAFRANHLLAEARSVPQAILAEVERGPADLVAVGARGLSAAKAFLLGSVSQAVARHAQASVLVVRGNLQRRPPRILLAVDGTAAGRRAAEFLPALLPPADARLTVMHVVNNPLVLAVSEYGLQEGLGLGAEAYQKALDADRRRGRRLLEQMREQLASRYPKADTLLAEGDVAEEILRAARRDAPDLVVVGRRGLSGLRKFLMGSVSQKVLSHAPGSVLVVH